MSKVLKIGGIGTLIGGLIVAGFAGVSLAFAQNPTVDTVGSNAMNGQGMMSGPAGVVAPLMHPGGPGPNGDGPLADYHDDIKAGIAEFLGMTVEELDQAREDGMRLQDILDDKGITREEFDAAVQEILADVLAQAVADGAITQEEADMILARGLRHGRGPGGPGGEGAGLLEDYHDEIQAGIADVLGLTVEELEQAREDGVRLPELLEQQGMTIEEFQAAMEPVWQSVLDQALADGAITQEQYDSLLERGFHAGGPGGPGGGHHRGGQGGPGNGPNGGPPEGAPGNGNDA